jgi:Flp pilus assembly pilin Flp
MKRRDIGGISVEYALLAAFIAAIVASSIFVFHGAVAELIRKGSAVFP